MPVNNSVDHKFKFLLSCIRWSDKGVIDFNAVAAECEIVSRAAASKRYSRLMKEHGINHNGSLTGNGGQATAPKNTQATGKKTQAELTKKRKLPDLTETLDETDDGSDADQVKNKSSKKPRKTSALATVSDEERLGMSAAGTNNGWVSEEFLAGFLPGPEDTSDGFIKTEEHDDEA